MTTSQPAGPAPADQPMPASPLAGAAQLRQMRGTAANIMLDVGGALTAIGSWILRRTHEHAEADVEEAYRLGHQHGRQAARADGQDPQA